MQEKRINYLLASHTTRDNPEDANECAAGPFHYMPSIDMMQIMLLSK